jgi:hypothetical protein
VTIVGEIDLYLILYGLPEVMPLERELLAKDFRLTFGSSSAIVLHSCLLHRWDGFEPQFVISCLSSLSAGMIGHK